MGYMENINILPLSRPGYVLRPFRAGEASRLFNLLEEEPLTHRCGNRILDGEYTYHTISHQLDGVGATEEQLFILIEHCTICGYAYIKKDTERVCIAEVGYLIFNNAIRHGVDQELLSVLVAASKRLHKVSWVETSTASDNPLYDDVLNPIGFKPHGMVRNRPRYVIDVSM